MFQTSGSGVARSRDDQACPDAEVSCPDADADTDTGDAVFDAPVDGAPGWGATLGLFDTNDSDAAGDAAGAGFNAGSSVDGDDAAGGTGDGSAEASVPAAASPGSDAAATTDPEAEPGWGATRGEVECPRVGPFWDHLADAQTAVASMLADLDTCTVPGSDLAEATVALHQLDSRVRAVHAVAVAQTVTAGEMPVWAVSAAAWVRHSHLLDSSRASTVARNAIWLAQDGHHLIRVAFENGEITADHVTAIRAVAAKTKARQAAFLAMQEHLVDVARNCDPAHTATTLKLWADAVDAADGDDEAEKAWNKRGLFLSPVGDGWDIRGYLPAAEGAELAGILGAFADKAYRARRANNDATDGHEDCDGDPGCDCDREGVEDKDPRTPAQQRADALMDLARAAGDADLTDGASSRAKITVLIPGERLWTCPSCGGHHHGPDESCHGPGHGLWAGTGCDAGTANTADAAAAAQAMADALAAGRPELHACSWAVGNGPGRGFLALSDALRLACDAEITRLVIGPDSQPLNVGRTTRTIPAHLRTALNVRDRGCVICPPGERPPGWCHAHHIQHWAAGGETGIHNLALLCHRHHRDLHHGIWTITIGPDHLPQVHPGPQHAQHQGRPRHPEAT